MAMKLSRHVRNNMRLYAFGIDDIQSAISTPDKLERVEENMVAIKLFAGRFSGYPLKVVYKNIGEIYVITAYPLKKAFKR